MLVVFLGQKNIRTGGDSTTEEFHSGIEPINPMHWSVHIRSYLVLLAIAVTIAIAVAIATTIAIAILAVFIVLVITIRIEHRY